MLASRAAVVTALLGSTLFFNLRAGLPGFSVTQVVLYVTVGSVYLLTALYLLWLHRKYGRIRLGLHIQVNIIFDVLVATLLVYVSGGVESPFTFFYALPIVNTAVFYSRRGTFWTAGLCCLFLGALFILESQGIIPINLEGRVQSVPTAGRVVYLLALNDTVFFVIAWLAGYLGEQLRHTGRELKRKEIDLEVLTALNRDIVRSLRSGLLVADPECRVTFLNPVAEDILGISNDDVQGAPVAEVFPALEGLVGSGSEAVYQRLEVDHHRQCNEALVPVGLTISPLQSAGGQEAGILVHMQDLTQQKEMEKSVKRAEKMAVMGGMAAAMAHEIRNPLASISGSVQMLSNAEKIGDSDRKLMEIVLRETGRLDALLADFLAYARPKEPRLVECSMKELVEETVSMFTRGVEGDPPRVDCDLDDLSVRVDPDQIRQVLWNLLANAVQASADGSPVLIRLGKVAKDRHEIQLEVVDRGAGVDEEIREKIFDPFFTTKDQGSGLGLATVGRIVEAHKGTIRLESPPEGGSRFIVRLPGAKR